MKNQDLCITAAGDMLIQRRVPDNYEGLKELREYILQGDARFFNLETTVNSGKGWGNQYNGGSYLRINPEILEDVKKYGFNMTTPANNHSMDFSHWGLLETIDALNASGLVHAGCGKNLSIASYLDTKNGRIGLIAATSTFEPPAMAGEQSRYYIGRPGVNGIRHKEIFQVTKDQMKIVRELAQATNVNAFDDIFRSEGYLPPLDEGEYCLGKLKFKLGDKTKRISTVNPTDMHRIEKMIQVASYQSDYIIVSIHSHEVKGTDKEVPDDFLVEFAHKCIDAGANAVIGHGPHLLRAIEIYKSSPIFYSLGDFMLENENIPNGPEDFYQMYNLTSDYSMYDLFNRRSQGFKKGLQADHRAFETVVPCIRMHNGKLESIILLPVECGFKQKKSMGGLPKIKRNAEFLERLAQLSKEFGTEIIVRNDGLGEVVL